MSDTVISVENISKLYRVGEFGTGSIAHDFNRWWHRVRGKEDPYTKVAQENDRTRKGESDYVWALKDVSFEVKQGEILGIIGRNGAGKSTLLKILSRVTSPTTGEIKVRGRIASLLEVGTGFNPEMTGRENIYLNGAILGMRKKEIDRKLEEIVDFSGVERYVDTPVKRYSSGMSVRLAFAVAAHLESEILIADEVLAVGDAEFQSKCLGKMKDVAGDGRTVLFVSHNLAAVNALTKTGVLMEKGTCTFQGPSHEAIARFLECQQSNELAQQFHEKADGQPGIAAVEVRCGQLTTQHVSGDPLDVAITINHSRPIQGACISLQIVNQYQQPVIHTWIHDSEAPFCRTADSTELVCTLPNLKLNVGRYSISVSLNESRGGSMLQSIEGVCPFEVVVLGRQIPLGWRADSCAYLEEFEWKVVDSGESKVRR